MGAKTSKLGQVDSEKYGDQDGGCINENPGHRDQYDRPQTGVSDLSSRHRVTASSLDEISQSKSDLTRENKNDKNRKILFYSVLI